MSGEADRETSAGYFNYFTEIEEHFQRVRGTSLFLLSPLDWALIESWKNSGVPLEAVLRGIDEAFEKWRARKQRARMVNSLAYCAQTVLSEAQKMAESGPRAASRTELESPFSAADLRQYIDRNLSTIRATGVEAFCPVVSSLEQIASSSDVEARDLESLEQRLSILEQKMIAIARVQQTEAEALKTRQELDSQLRPWRGRMTASQIAMLEAQFLDRAVLHAAGLPRLSLFYLKEP
jgi:hypothetical protein